MTCWSDQPPFIKHTQSWKSIRLWVTEKKCFRYISKACAFCLSFRFANDHGTQRKFLGWYRPIEGVSVEPSSISKETPKVLSTRPNDSENNMASTKVIHHALARDLSTALFDKNAYVIVCNCTLYKVLLQICLAIQYAILSIFLFLEIPPNPKLKRLMMIVSESPVCSHRWNLGLQIFRNWRRARKSHNLWLVWNECARQPVFDPAAW